MAGAAHADTYTVRRTSRRRHAERRPHGRVVAPTTNLMIGQTDTPINAGPQQHYVAQAALVTSSDGRRAEKLPSRPSLELNGDRTGYVLDEHGIARVGSARRGDVAGGSHGGLGQTGETSPCCSRTGAFRRRHPGSLYPGGRNEYLERFRASLDHIAAGFLLEEEPHRDLAVAGTPVSPAARRRVDGRQGAGIMHFPFPEVDDVRSRTELVPLT